MAKTFEINKSFFSTAPPFKVTRINASLLEKTIVTTVGKKFAFAFGNYIRILNGYFS